MLWQDLEKHPGLGHYLSGVSVRVKELEEACAYVATKNKIPEVICLLNQYKVAFMISPLEIDELN